MTNGSADKIFCQLGTVNSQYMNRIRYYMFLILPNIIKCILNGIKTKDKRTFLRPHCRIHFDRQCFKNILPTHLLYTCGQRTWPTCNSPLCFGIFR